MDCQKIAIRRMGSRSFLEIGLECIEVAAYNVACASDGSTRMEVTFDFNSQLTEIEMSATKEALTLQNLNAAKGKDDKQ